MVSRIILRASTTLLPIYVKLSGTDLPACNDKYATIQEGKRPNILGLLISLLKIC